MKKYKLVKVEKEENVAREIENQENEGWKLVSYNPVSPSTGIYRHFILFSREV
jgi:hypothetical protein